MILNVIKKGVLEDCLVWVFNVDIINICMKWNLFVGICFEVVEFLKDWYVFLNVFRLLKVLKLLL